MPRLTDRPSLPPVTPPPRAALPPSSPTLLQRSWAALTLAALSLLSMTLMGSANIRRTTVAIVVALVIAALALGLAISAMSAARRAGTARPRGSVLATVLASIGLVIGALVLVGFAMFWPQLTRLSDCMRGAATVSEQSACQQQYDNSVGAEMRVLGSR